MYVGNVKSPEERAEHVMIVVSKPIALSMAVAIIRHAEGQMDGEIRLDHPDVDSNDILSVGRAIHTFARRGLR